MELHIMGICGSLRQKSFNLSALKTAGELMPSNMKLEIVGIADIPMFNQDVFDKGMPPAAAKFRADIAKADALLIASPEFNYSLTGALKNAIDWASRQPDMPLTDKPVAIISAATGPVGGARGQYDLRRILGQLNTFILVRPEVFIGMAASKFDAEGRLTDEPTRKVMADQMTAFHDWIMRIRKMTAK